MRYYLYMYGDKSKISSRRFFFEHPVFRYEEFADWKREQGLTQASSIQGALQYFLRTGQLVRIRRKLYGVLSPNETPENMAIDSYLLAAKAAEDSILAYHTALELWGLAYSSFEQFTFLTFHKVKPFTFHDQWFQPIAIPCALRKQYQESYGVVLLNRQGVNIKVTNIARTFVDTLDRVDLCGGWEEAYRSLQNIAALNVEEVIHYCLLLNNSVLAAKVGYFLELRQGAFSVSSKMLRPLLKKKPISPQYVTKNIQEPCRFISKWNLMMPESIIQQTWEERQDDF